MVRDEPVRLAIVGCGRIGGSYLRAAAAVPEARLAAVVDPVAEARLAVAREHGVRPFASVEDLIGSGAAEAAIVCTPPATHVPLTEALLRGGLHVICEKPFALTSEQARAVTRIAGEQDRILMMASKFRYVEDVSKAKGIVESGILGKIVLFENIFCSRVDMRGRWNAEPAVSGGGVLIDNGSHAVDIARYLLGPVVEVQAQHGVRAQDLPVEDTSRLLFRSASGVMGAIDLSWSIHKEVDWYICLYGSQGTLRIGWQGSQYRQSERNEWVPFGSGYDKERALGNQVRNFVRSIQGKEMPVITAVDGLESVRVIEAAYRSGRRNHWVPVEG
jgi:predicted dehydrogenase